MNLGIQLDTIYPSTTQFPEVLAHDRELLQRILQTNLSLSPGQKVVVVTDKALRQVGEIWFEAAKALGNDAEMLVLQGMSRDGEQPPQEILARCETAEVLILHTLHSLTHTDASKVARQQGSRVASLPGATLEVVQRTLDMDYTGVKELGTTLQKVLSRAKTIHITSEYGTDLTAQVRQDQVIDDNGFIPKGEVGNLPAGEVFFAPLEGTAQGTWVVNGSLASETLDEEVVIQIEKGKAMSIEGRGAAQRLKEKLTQVGDAAFIIAEIGIGTNKLAQPTAELLEAEKAYGTAHLALGNNFFFGGTNNVPIHIDGVTLCPTITLDETKILESYTFRLPPL